MKMTLPLFPLDTVLFPGCLLDLQIFEARYRHDQPLHEAGRWVRRGVHPEGEQVGKAPPVVASVGCEALIRDFVQQENGLLGIRVEGVRRFRLEQTEVQKDQLMVGDVHWLPELADSALSERDDDLLALLQALGEHPMVAALDMPRAVDGCQSLANQLGYLLPFMEEDKLDLLAIDSPQLRLEAIQNLLDRIQGELFA